MAFDPAAKALRDRFFESLSDLEWMRRRGVFGRPALSVPGTLFAFFYADRIVVKVSPELRLNLLESDDVYEWVPEGSGMRSFGEWIAVPIAGRSDSHLGDVLRDAYARAANITDSSMDPPDEL